MTYAVWPSILPQAINQDGYSEAEPESRLFTEMDTGPPKTRIENDAAPIPLRGRIIIESYQMARLTRFFRDDLVKGSLPFIAPNQRYHGLNLMTENYQYLLVSNGRPLALSSYYIVMFGREGLSWSAAGGLLWQAEFSWWILP